MARGGGRGPGPGGVSRTSESAPLIVRQVGASLRRLSNMGTAVQLVEKNLRFCLDIASGADIIDKGRVVCMAAPRP